MNSYTKKIFFLITLLIGTFAAHSTYAHQCSITNSNEKTVFNLSHSVVENNEIRSHIKEQSPFDNNERNDMVYSELEDEDYSNDYNKSEKTTKDIKYLSAQNFFSSFIYDYFLRHIYRAQVRFTNYSTCTPFTFQHIYILFSIIRI